MMPLQTNTHLEVFLLGFLGCRQKTADTGRVRRHGLFRENMLALADCFLELHGAKTWRRRENDHVRH